MQLEEHTDIDLLITRYLSGKLDKESFAELKRWSLESESNRKYVRNKLEVWFSSGAADTAVRFYSDNGLPGRRRNKNRCSVSHGKPLCG